MFSKIGGGCGNPDWHTNLCLSSLPSQAKCCQPHSSKATGQHKDDVVFGLEDAQSPAVVTSFRYMRAPRGTWKPAPANDTPAETSWPLTEVEFILSLCWFTKETSGIALACLLNRSILFNPRDDAFSLELKIALRPPPQGHYSSLALNILNVTIH